MLLKMRVNRREGVQIDAPAVQQHKRLSHAGSVIMQIEILNADQHERKT